METAMTMTTLTMTLMVTKTTTMVVIIMTAKATKTISVTHCPDDIKRGVSVGEVSTGQLDHPTL